MEISEKNSVDRTLAILRKRILEGAYAAGSRLTEAQAAKDVGVSRTPIRIAFRALEIEGYLEQVGARGYTVRSVSIEDVRHSLYLRGVLEGEAARRLAMIGLPLEAEEIMADCIAKETVLFRNGHLDQNDIAEYGRLNEVFHTTLLAAAGSAHLQTAVSQLAHLPTGITNAIIERHSNLQKEYFRLLTGHLHHCIVLRAIQMGDGSRAEAVMREHAFVRIDYASIIEDAIGDQASK